MRRFFRPFWVLLALVFLVEAWLWDRLQPVVGWIVDRIPLEKMKAQVVAWVEGLTPAQTLIVFLVPLAILLPFKIAGLWLLAEGEWLGAIAVLLMAKILALGATAFVFDVTRDSLLQLFWFRWIYGHVMAWRDWAHILVDPIKRRIKVWFYVFAPRRAKRAFRLFLRIRRRMHATQNGGVKLGRSGHARTSG